MCRVLMYAGEPVSLDSLLFRPNNSLVRQTIHPQMLDMQSLAGFGMLAWDLASRRPVEPFVYRSVEIPLFDPNLKALATKLDVSTVLAHARGVSFEGNPLIGPESLHPFHYPECRVALAHNGFLAHFEDMRFALTRHIKPLIARRMRSNTDSEWIYALLMSQLDDPAAECSADDAVRAVEKTLKILREERRSHGISTPSAVNLFMTNGDWLVSIRFTFDFGCYDMSDVEKLRDSGQSYLGVWYTSGRSYGLRDGEWKMLAEKAGEGASVLVSSEPLTRDTSTWFEVPEYSALTVANVAGRRQCRVQFIDA